MLPDRRDEERSSALAREEQAVNDGLLKAEEGYIEAGKALGVIRDRKLYRKRASSWREYCLTLYAGKNWSVDPSTANRAIAAVKTADVVSAGNGVIPKVETVAREVRLQGKGDPQLQRQIWELAVASHPAKAPTAGFVKAAAKVLKTRVVTGGYVPTFEGDAMVAVPTVEEIVATSADDAEIERRTQLAAQALITATVAQADEQVKRSAQHAHDANANKTGALQYNSIVWRTLCKLESADPVSGLVTFRVASNAALYIRDGFHDSAELQHFLSVSHLVDTGEESREQTRSQS